MSDKNLVDGVMEVLNEAVKGAGGDNPQNIKKARGEKPVGLERGLADKGSSKITHSGTTSVNNAGEYAAQILNKALSNIDKMSSTAFNRITEVY